VPLFNCMVGKNKRIAVAGLDLLSIFNIRLFEADCHMAWHLEFCDASMNA
jgi:hypothetical protein